MIGANVLGRLGGPACPGLSSWAPRASTRGRPPSRSRRRRSSPGRSSRRTRATRCAKIATLELGKMYRRQFGMNVVSLMPATSTDQVTTSIGQGHVLAALLRKIHEAKVSGAHTVEVWEPGAPRREFLHVDDLADAALFALRNYEGESHLNVGTGRDITIRELASRSPRSWAGRELVFNTDARRDASARMLSSSMAARMDRPDRPPHGPRNRPLRRRIPSSSPDSRESGGPRRLDAIGRPLPLSTQAEGQRPRMTDQAAVSAQLGELLALPRAALHPRLARRDGPVQASAPRGRVGRAAAPE